jgi:hypothetical protein
MPVRICIMKSKSLWVGCGSYALSMVVRLLLVNGSFQVVGIL